MAACKVMIDVHTGTGSAGDAAAMGFRLFFVKIALSVARSFALRSRHVVTAVFKSVQAGP